MSKFTVNWQDRALLYVQNKLNTEDYWSKKKIKLIFVRLCEYALANNLWDNGKLTLSLSVDDMASVANASRSATISALQKLSECGAITRIGGGESNPITPRFRGRPISITVINFTDEDNYSV